MENILMLLKANLEKEGISLQDLKIETYTNQIVVKANNLKVSITTKRIAKRERFSVAVADSEGVYSCSIGDVFDTVEEAIKYSVVEIREMLNSPKSVEDMLLDCFYDFEYCDDDIEY